MKINFDLPTKEMVQGPQSLSYITSENNKEVKISDICYIITGNNINNYITKSKGSNYGVFKKPFKKNTNQKPSTGLRPIISAKEAEKITSYKTEEIKIEKQTFKIAEFGHFPQTIEQNTSILNTLNSYQVNYSLKIVKDCIFTFNTNNDRYLIKSENYIYEYNNNFYIHKRSFNDNILPSGEKITEGVKYWIKVEPIKWVIDEKTGIWISKDVLTTEIPFSKSDKNYNGDFQKTTINEYLNKYFSKEILFLSR